MTKNQPQISKRKCKESPYYKNYEEKRRKSGKVARIKHKAVRRIVKKKSSKRTEYRSLMVYLMGALLMV